MFSGRLPEAAGSSGHDSHPAWGLVLTGGYGVHGRGTDRVVTMGGTSVFESPLPEPMYSHCAVIVDENRVFVAGGYDTRKRAYLYDRKTKYVYIDEI